MGSSYSTPFRKLIVIVCLVHYRESASLHIAHKSTVLVTELTLEGFNVTATAQTLGPGGCTYFGGAGSDHIMPYSMYHVNADGSQDPADAVLDPGGTGLCIYPEVTCTFSSCFEVNPWVQNGSAESQGIFTLMGLIILGIFLMIVWTIQTPGVFHSVIFAVAMITMELFFCPFEMLLACFWPSRPSPPNTAFERDETSEDIETDTDSKKEGNCCGITLFVIGVYISISVSVTLAISIQKTLTVSERNSLLAADGFLKSVGDVFQFLEDAVSVRIAFALGAKDYDAARLILSLGMMGGAGWGIVAAVLMTLLAMWPAAIQALLAPNVDASASCDLVPSAAEVVSATRLFWLLTSWSWPLAFANMACTGYLLGSGRWGAFGFALGLAMLVVLEVWLVGTQHTDRHLDVLGWATILSTITFFCVSLLFVSRELLSSTKASPAADEESSAETSSTGEEGVLRFLGLSGLGAEAIRQGLFAMILDVCMQVELAVGFYVAAASNAGQLYQISSMQAAMPLFGTSLAQGLGYGLRMVAAALIGRGRLHEFYLFAQISLFFIMAITCVTLFSTLPYHTQIAFDFGRMGAVYASSSACAPMYKDIFGSGASSYGTIVDSFSVFTWIATSLSLFTCLKSLLYGCFDFAFLAISGVITLVFVFVPAVCYAHFVVNNARALYVAMYSPVVVLAVVYLIRLRMNMKKMLRGEEGPWSNVDGSTT